MSELENPADVSKSAATPCYVPIIATPLVNWFEIDFVGLPPQVQNEFYGDRYSVPVLIADAVTGQVEPHTVVYDYQDGGWCLVGFPDGPSCHNYDLATPTHYCLIPQFAV